MFASFNSSFFFTVLAVYVVLLFIGQVYLKDIMHAFFGMRINKVILVSTVYTVVAFLAWAAVIYAEPTTGAVLFVVCGILEASVTLIQRKRILTIVQNEVSSSTAF